MDKIIPCPEESLHNFRVANYQLVELELKRSHNEGHELNPTTKEVYPTCTMQQFQQEQLGIFSESTGLKNKLFL